MPALSPTMETGGIGSWHKKEGDLIEPGDILASIETDKASVDFEVTDEYYLAKILYPEGTADIEVNQVIAIGTEEEDEVKELMDRDVSSYLSGGSKVIVEETIPEVKETPKVEKVVPAPAEVKSNSTRLILSPLMKSTFANELNKLQAAWDNGFRGSGPDGRIIQRDTDNVKKALEQPSQSQSQSQQAKQTVPELNISDDAILTRDDFVSLKRNLSAESKRNVPHYYLNARINVDNTLQFLLNFNSTSNKNISLNAVVLKALTSSAFEHEFMRYKWNNDDIQFFNNVNLNLHAHTQFKVIRNSESKGLSFWSNVSLDEEIKLSETQNGTMSVRLNANGYENCIDRESCFVNVGDVEEKLILQEGNAVVSKYINLYASFDHRTVDGADGANFLKAVRERVENPFNLIL